MAFKFSNRLNDEERQIVEDKLAEFHKANEKIDNYNRAIRKERQEARDYLKYARANKIKLSKNEREQLNYLKGQKLKKKIPGKAIIEDLRDKGLSYSEKNMYHDIRRMGAFYNASTPEKRRKAIDWFDNYFEKLRKEKGLTAKQAYRIWERAKKQSYDNMSAAELEFALELREMGSP